MWRGKGSGGRGMGKQRGRRGRRRNALPARRRDRRLGVTHAKRRGRAHASRENSTTAPHVFKPLYLCLAWIPRSSFLLSLVSRVEGFGERVFAALADEGCVPLQRVVSPANRGRTVTHLESILHEDQIVRVLGFGGVRPLGQRRASGFQAAPRLSLQEREVAVLSLAVILPYQSPRIGSTREPELLRESLQGLGQIAAEGSVKGSWVPRIRFSIDGAEEVENLGCVQPLESGDVHHRKILHGNLEMPLRMVDREDPRGLVLHELALKGDFHNLALFECESPL